ncbi:MAG: hypothetical protein Q8873_01975 [Bacillota bacterium]|nr:hypothetical protein [Bacillota bacterium]
MKVEKIKLISGILAGVMILSVGAMAYAANSNSNSADKGRKIQMVGEKPGNAFGFKSNLSKLVTAGIITQEQSDKILQYLKDRQAEMKTEREKIASMTKEERKAYFEENKDSAKPGNMLEGLVTASIITQEQSDKISQYLKDRQTEMKAEREKSGVMNGKQGKAYNAKPENTLAGLVTAGTITQEQSDKISQYLENRQAEMKAEHEKIASMTNEERKAYFEEKKDSVKPENMLASLVTDGTLTQAQADSVIKAFAPKNINGMEGGKRGDHPGRGFKGRPNKGSANTAAKDTSAAKK